jgi:thiol-disulfide isomerase/thioredoxin
MRYVLVAAMLWVTLALMGCDAQVVSSPPAAGGPVNAPGPTAVNLVIGDEKKLGDLLEKHKGQVVFVDYWATWCESCVEFFPHTVATSKKYKDQGLATIAVSFDLLDDEAKVREFLTKKGADFENLLSSYDDIGQEVADAFDFGVLPQFRLYDRSGKVRYEWKDKPQDLDQRIEELLAEKL